MKYRELIDWLMRSGISPDEAESMVRGNFRHALRVFNAMRTIDKQRAVPIVITP